MSAGGVSCSVDMSENVDGVAKSAEFCAIGNRSERLPLIRGNAESSAIGEVGVPAPTFCHHKPIVTAWSERGDRGV